MGKEREQYMYREIERQEHAVVNPQVVGQCCCVLHASQRATHLQFLQLLEGLVAVLVGHVDAGLQLLQVQLQLLARRHRCGALLPLVLQLHLHLSHLNGASLHEGSSSSVHHWELAEQVCGDAPVVSGIWDAFSSTIAVRALHVS